MGNIKRFKRIYIEITSSCNLKCSFCQETKRPAHFMPIEDFGHMENAGLMAENGYYYVFIADITDTITEAQKNCIYAYI